METKRIRNHMVVCMAAAALVTCAGRVHAQATLEVNQNDPGATYRTIGAAVTAAGDGDTILVHPGIYEEIITISGITLRALRGPEVTVIQSPDGTGIGVTLTGNKNVTLCGFRIQGFVEGVFINTDGGNTKVSHCVAAGNSSHGISIGAAVPATVRVLNNISADNGGDGIAAVSRKGTLSSVCNNIIYRNGRLGFDDHDLFGTTVFGNYNCVYANTSGTYGSNDSSGPDTIQTNPSIDPVKHYRFTSQASPCVNKGHPATFYNDPDGSRNDMGAYGGDEAANWWRDPFTGPTVENVTVDPPQVRPGGTITIRATATTE